MIMSVFPIDNWVSFIENVLESPTTYSAGVFFFFLSFLWTHYIAFCQSATYSSLFIFFCLLYLIFYQVLLLPGKSHGQRSLVGCSPWRREESDTTERLHFHFSLSCIGGGNGNPLQCSCLENPWDRGAWWAAVFGVAQSRTRLTWLSSSSNVALL